jgi:hypothetical protein
MSQFDPNEFWASLDKIGESEVRKRLAQNVYGAKKRPLIEEWLRKKATVEHQNIAQKEQERRDTELEISKRSFKVNRIIAIAALISVIISFGALILSWLAFRSTQTEQIILRAQRFMGDHASQMIPQSGMLGPALLDTYWECLLSNTGDRAVSIKEANVWKVENGGLSQYGKMRGGVLDAMGEPISLPATLEPGHSTKFLFLLRPSIAESAYKILTKEYQNNSIPSLLVAQNLLAGNHLDFFGNQIAPFFDGGKVTGFRVESTGKQPYFAFKFLTSREKTIASFAAWYPSPGS